jgi:hypothetical protein
MSIKNKLLFVVILISFSFLIVLSFAFFSMKLILDLKSVELQSSNILIKWGYLQSTSKAILVSTDPLESLQKKNLEALNDFDKFFNNFQKNQNKIFINDDIKLTIINSNKVWLLIKNSLGESQKSLNELVNLIKTGVFYNNLDNKSLLQICYSNDEKLNIKNNNALFLVLVNELLNADNNIDYSANIFNQLLNDLNEHLIKFANYFVASIVIIAAIL